MKAAFLICASLFQSLSQLFDGGADGGWIGAGVAENEAAARLRGERVNGERGAIDASGLGEVDGVLIVYTGR